MLGAISGRAIHLVSVEGSAEKRVGHVWLPDAEAMLTDWPSTFKGDLGGKSRIARTSARMARCLALMPASLVAGLPTCCCMRSQSNPLA